MPLPLVTIILSGATAGITHFFQKTANNNKRENDKRETELTRAETIFKEISIDFSKIYSQYYLYMRNLVVRSSSEKIPEFDEQNYRAWQEKAPYNLGIVRATFGNEIAQHFEKIIEDIEGCYHCIFALTKFPNKSEEFQLRTIEQFYKKIDDFSGHMTEIINQMLQQIQDHNVGGLRLKY